MTSRWRAIGLLPALVAAASGCNPYMAAISAASATYGAATDERSLGTQASDDEIEARIKADLVASPVAGTGGLDVFCRRGVVVLAGVVAHRSPAGAAAVRIARAAPGVRRVETFFVSDRPSRLHDQELTEEIKAAFVEDSRVREREVAVGVYAGHVVLVGVVPSWEAVDAFVDDARGVDGVASVRSYLQVG